jgi:arginyl-tRNA synthetase
MSLESFIATIISNNCDLTLQEVTNSLMKVNGRSKLKNGLGDYSIALRKFGQDRCDALEHHFNTLILPNNEYVTEVKIINAQLNIYINKSVTINTLINIYTSGATYGMRAPLNKTVIIEFSSPNIAKPFHAGHLRSTILGQFLVNLHRFTGHNVIAMNYLGDWGKQFGILGIGIRNAGLTLDNLKMLDDPIKTLGQIYVDINAQIKREKSEQLALYSNGLPKESVVDEETIKRLLGIQIVSKTDQEAKKYFTELELTTRENEETSDIWNIWKYVRDISLKKYQNIYTNLGIQFDVYSGESEYRTTSNLTLLQPIINQAVRQEGTNTVYVDLSNESLGELVLIKNDGSSLYSLRDLLAALDRNGKYNFDKMLYVVASEQEYYFKQLFSVLGRIDPELTDKCRHISFGMVEGMSTRTGNVILLESILETSAQQMMEKIKENDLVENVEVERTARILGKSAVFIQDFKAERSKNYKFEWSRATDFQGQTGPYIQYSHVRLHNIIEKARERNIHLPPNPQILNPDELYTLYTLLQEPETLELMFMMTEWTSILDKCLVSCSAHTLVGWLFDFIRCIFKAYNTISVVNCDNQAQAEARLLLFDCCKTIISNSLNLLGLEPLEKM